ncbi:alpha-mannosidase [Alkalicoccus daliensis]|uniref:Alpha-mannosidase n=1 Tax=Alkalicoccus daliensis TaxID=745820 RepID=A0A1H0F815_9BACI|nr:alpha-mannosidase [Alkalicoccus daliensis]SDN90735.1 alpha-mannosidase [Alkalicoccus daliensis]
MFLTEKKLEQRIEELSDYRYVVKETIDSFFYYEETDDTRPDMQDYQSWNTLPVPAFWQGWDKYIWMAASVKIPLPEEGRRPVCLFNFGKTGGGNNSGFESLLYVNGSPYQGVDSNHTEVFFKEKHTGSSLDLTFRLWSGLDGMLGKYEEQEHKIEAGVVALLDEETDDLYFNSRALLETIELLEVNDPVRVSLLSLLNKSFNELDWRHPGSEQFYHSVKSANFYLHQHLEKMNNDHPVTITNLGHTHIDVAWLWRLKHTREKCGRSFTTVLRLMEMYPEYIFLQTQPQLYEYVKDDYPEIYEEIKHRVKEGRWETGGSMWLESDANLPTGESLIRQLLMGQSFFNSEFGDSGLKYLWLPDVFGYSWALPQILKKSGIETFMTTKISWNQYNRMPHDTFMWRGIDGSEILTHFVTTPDPSSRYTYNGMIDAKSIKGIWDEYKDKQVNQELLLAYGYGDGGGGVTRDMLEMRRRFDKVPGMPNMTTGRADDYFTRLKETVENTDEYVHTWDGELYLEYHRGTYTSQAYNKKMNRKLELLFRDAEIIDVMASLHQSDLNYTKHDALQEGWKIILRNQFHDIIPGSSIREVYEDSKIEYAEAKELGAGVLKEGLKVLTNGSGTYTVFNSSSWKQSNLVHVRAHHDKEGNWKDADGNMLQAQKDDQGWRVLVEDIPALGFAAVSFKEEKGSQVQSEVETGEGCVTTPYYEVTWNEQGHLTQILDRKHKRQVLAGGCGNVFQIFEDKPLNFDAWDIDIFYQEKYRTVTALKEVEVIAEGPLRTVIRFTWKYEDSTIEQDMILYNHSRRIDFQTKVNWQENNQLLKVGFPVNVRSTEATYDIQFGNVKRPTHWNTSWDMARFETVGHQWADLSERNYGVSLLNDCKYGYDIKNNVMRLSLIKSATQPDAKQDIGKHTFTYSLLPHSGDWYEGETVKEAWFLNNPLISKEGNVTREQSLFTVNQDNIMIDAVKKSEHGSQAVLRFHEYSGQSTEVTLESSLNIRRWQECDLMERPIGEAVNEDIITASVTPYEIKTYLVTFAK